MMIVISFITYKKLIKPPQLIRATASFIRERQTDIGWNKKYFENPIVAGYNVSIIIWDDTKTNKLAVFKSLAKKDNPLKNGSQFYVPTFKNKLLEGQIVIYEMKTKTKKFEFAITVLGD